MPSNQSLETTVFLPPALQLSQPCSFGDEAGYFLQMTESLVHAHRVGWGFNLCFMCLLGGGANSCHLKKKKVCRDSCLLKSCCWPCRLRASCRHTSTCAHRRDGQERTDGQETQRHAHPRCRGEGARWCRHTPPAPACVCRAAGALARQAEAGARLLARRSGVGTRTTANGLGGEGR